METMFDGLFLSRYLNMSVEGQEAVTTVTPGQYILIEGNDDDNPFVAKLLKFFGDGESWFNVMQCAYWLATYLKINHD